MISVEQAEQIIFSHLLTLNTEGVEFSKTYRRVLAEDLAADRPMPPFDRVTMDGVAFCFSKFEHGQRRFKIENTQAAGEPQRILSDKTACLEVMTGAILPVGCDAVVRYEDVKIVDGFAEIQIENVEIGQNIHRKGSDRQQNEVLILRGRKICATEIATAATIGKSILQVKKLPRTAIISTGDELVDVAATPEAHQIRRSNSYAVAALLEENFRIAATLFHFDDDEKAITDGLRQILEDFELVILSGAVSEGKFDFVPKVLAELGVEKLFHKVAQRPGKPFWFGRFGDSAVVFALPGNPVSTFMCAVRYVVPFVERSLGLENKTHQYARLAEDFSFKPPIAFFLQVKIENSDGILLARPIAGGGSGDLANLNDADGFLELPAARSDFRAGEAFRLIRFPIK